MEAVYHWLQVVIIYNTTKTRKYTSMSGKLDVVSIWKCSCTPNTFIISSFIHPRTWDILHWLGEDGWKSNVIMKLSWKKWMEALMNLSVWNQWKTGVLFISKIRSFENTILVKWKRFSNLSRFWHYFHLYKSLLYSRGGHSGEIWYWIKIQYWSNKKRFSSYLVSGLLSSF